MKQKSSMSKPKVSSSFAQSELDKAEKQFEAFNDNVKEMTHDRLNAAPKEEVEQQTKMSNREMQNSKDIYLKPKRSLPPGMDPKSGYKEKFNEKFRNDWNFAKEYVQFIAENREIIGENIELWTKPFPGIECEFWEVPVNKPVWGPRYLAEKIKKCTYHRLKMDEQRASNLLNSDSMGAYTGAIAVDTVVQRLDAYPVSQKKSVFMGNAGNF